MAAPKPGKTKPVAPTTITMHQALVELGVEFLAIVILVLLAGASPRGAKIATTTLASLWFVSLILYYNGSI